MILIISQTHDASTDDVIDWIDFYGEKFQRLNGVDFYKTIKISIDNSCFDLKFGELELDKIRAIWYRRWVGFEDRHDILLKQSLANINPIKNQFNHFIREELRSLVAFFFDSIPEEKVFGRLDPNEINKLKVLKKARDLGIMIPKTLILTNRGKLQELAGQYRVITKAISNSPFIEHEREMYLGYTAEVLNELPEEVPAQFMPSLFQNLIQKKYEIRSFFLQGKFYSMAIFSQAEQQTQLDFRNYNYRKSNRTCPYQLPAILEEKLRSLADHFGLNACSFDLVKTPENDHVFLEVNPGGQFGMVSYPCNYHLEKKLAFELIQHSRNGNTQDSSQTHPEK